MLKPLNAAIPAASKTQPPSGGCVLKLWKPHQNICYLYPAAFGRLCVETEVIAEYKICQNPAAFGRLCVETK